MRNKIVNDNDSGFSYVDGYFSSTYVSNTVVLGIEIELNKESCKCGVIRIVARGPGYKDIEWTCNDCLFK